jgi:hypothetical protein
MNAALRASVKDAVESRGVPHTEVALVVIDGMPRGWETILEEGARVEIYGQDTAGELAWSLRVDQPPPSTVRFLLDVHLGKLASWLRLLGFDAAYSSDDPGDEVLARRASEEKRVLLTGDRQLLMRSGVMHGYLLRSRDPVVQTGEVLERYGLRELAEPFTRCLACNGPLVETTRARIDADAPPLVRKRYGLDPKWYRVCADCGRLYWWGTHSDRMAGMLERWEIDFTPRIPPPES